MAADQDRLGRGPLLLAVGSMCEQLAGFDAESIRQWNHYANPRFSRASLYEADLAGLQSSSMG
jgi:hypothetical protein